MNYEKRYNNKRSIARIAAILLRGRGVRRFVIFSKVTEFLRSFSYEVKWIRRTVPVRRDSRPPILVSRKTTII